MVITLFALSRVMDKFYTLLEGKEILFFVKAIWFVLNWTLSLAWLWFAIKVINLYKKEVGNKMYLLLLLLPVAFWHNVFLTFFLIYYSFVPFAP
jgi:hypothetical protein